MSRSGPGRARHADVRGILDTSTVILLDRLTDASALPEHPQITTITVAELSVGPLVADDPRERAVRQAGRKPSARAYDALIAAVALANELPLYTVNPADFQDIDGLTVRSIPHPGAAPAV